MFWALRSCYWSALDRASASWISLSWRWRPLHTPLFRRSLILDFENLWTSLEGLFREHERENHLSTLFAELLVKLEALLRSDFLLSWLFDQQFKGYLYHKFLRIPKLIDSWPYSYHRSLIFIESRYRRRNRFCMQKGTRFKPSNCSWCIHSLRSKIWTI